MNEHYIDFDLFAFPDAGSGLEYVAGQGKSRTLVLHNAIDASSENQLFLENVFKAVQMAPLLTHLFLLDVDASGSISAVALARQLGVETVYGFGLDWTQVGIRAQLPAYQFIRLGDVSFLNAHSIDTIRKDREAKRSEKAGALWNAMKAKYL